jgi:hypothetical protein
MGSFSCDKAPLAVEKLPNHGASNGTYDNMAAKLFLAVHKMVSLDAYFCNQLREELEASCGGMVVWLEW